MAAEMYHINQAATDDKLKEVMVFYSTAMQDLGWGLVTYQDVEKEGNWQGGVLLFVKDIYDEGARE